MFNDKIDRHALKHYRAAGPKRRRMLARHVAKLGIEMMADANAIPLGNREGVTFVDPESGEVAVYLEHTAPADLDASEACSDPSCAECLRIDVAALLGEVSKFARDKNIPIGVAIDHVVSAIHAWRDPLAEAYN